MVLEFENFYVISEGIYLMAFGIYGEVMAIYYYIGYEEYIFAALQISLSIIGFCIFGLGKLCSTFKWWQESIANGGGHVGKYGLLRKQLSVMSIAVVGLPSLSLTIYATMTTNIPTSELMFSVGLALMKVSCKAAYDFHKFDEKAKKRQTELGKNREFTRRHSSVHSTSSSQIPSPKMSSKPKELSTGRFSGRMASFTVSDYYIRSIPILMILSSIAPDSRIMAGIIIFGSIWVFECFAAYFMRAHPHCAPVVISSGPMIFSSSYTMFQELNVLKRDVRPIIFSGYLVEHGIRCAVGLAICCVFVAMEFNEMADWYTNKYCRLSGLFVEELIKNGCVIYRIYKSQSHLLEQQNVQSIELQSAQRNESHIKAAQKKSEHITSNERDIKAAQKKNEPNIPAHVIELQKARSDRHWGGHDRQFCIEQLKQQNERAIKMLESYRVSYVSQADKNAQLSVLYEARRLYR